MDTCPETGLPTGHCECYEFEGTAYFAPYVAAQRARVAAGKTGPAWQPDED